MIVVMANRFLKLELKSTSAADKITAERRLKNDKRFNFTKNNINDVVVFSTFQPPNSGSTILSMRMPNGDLAGLATQAILELDDVETEILAMVGAGGTFDSDAKIGDYQIIHKSIYQNKTVKINENQLVK